MVSRLAFIICALLAVVGILLSVQRTKPLEADIPAPQQSSSQGNCEPDWHFNLVTDTSRLRGQLNAVAARGNDIWAVGNAEDTPLTVRWNGYRWSSIYTPEGSGNINRLRGIAIVGPDDIWAVGGYVPVPQPKTKAGFDIIGVTLIEHWNGVQWTIVPSPSPGAESWLFGVSAIGPKNIWAVGQVRETYWNRPLILHWDGASWKQVPSPHLSSPNASDAELNAIAAVQHDEIWAVGAQNIDADGFGGDTLILRWNGKNWIELPGLGGGRLLAISASGLNNVWTVGYFSPTRRHEAWFSYTLAFHWNGKKWIKIATPNPGDYGSELSGVTITNPGNVWAVGVASATQKDGGGYKEETLALRWSGSSWTRLSSPNPGEHNRLWSVYALENRRVWAVGEDYADGTILVAEYWKLCAVPTSQPNAIPQPNPAVRDVDPHKPGVIYFAAVGHTLRSGFREYWEKNGGLEQFGYPITEEFQEGGNTVQYFERARFEWHPELAQQFRVQQGLLTYDLMSMRRTDEPFQPHPMLLNADTVYFAETMHNLAPEFVGYWGTHGGKGVYGYPISEPFSEVNAADGKQYLVQYFPRQRFEYHPELLGPVKVKLGLLGVEAAMQQGLLH